MRSKRQAHDERCAFAKPAFDGEPTTMAVEHVFHQGKPEAGAAFRAALADIDPIESLGESRQMLIGDAGSVIANADESLANAVRGLDALEGNVDALAGSVIS